MKRLAALLCLTCAARAFAADLPLYATVSAGLQIGGFQSALSAKPYQINSRHRDAFTSSVGLGWKINSRVALEAAYSDFGNYEFDQEYGISPFVPPGFGTFQVTSHVLIREELAGFSFRVPLHFAFSPRWWLEVSPGANRLKLREHFFSRYVTGIVVAPNPPGPLTVVDTPFFSRTSSHWRPEGKASLNFAFNDRLAANVGYLYTDVARKKLSVVSVGGRFDF